MSNPFVIKEKTVCLLCKVFVIQGKMFPLGNGSYICESCLQQTVQSNTVETDAPADTSSIIGGLGK